ncbi:MAG: hypothetical protein KDA83_19880 [Planctomycetales bacterium]|nr:hypothetical protein [Planctomycetales bacterium]
MAQRQRSSNFEVRLAMEIGRKQQVEITFDCVPLRSVRSTEAPAEGSPKFQALVKRIGGAIEKHGRHNSYYLHTGIVRYQLTNSAKVGELRFAFEGTVLTDAADQLTRSADLTISLNGDTCDWLTEPVVNWFHETVRRAVMVEFDRYIDAGDLARTQERIDQLSREADQSGGFLGMGI